LSLPKRTEKQEQLKYVAQPKKRAAPSFYPPHAGQAIKNLKGLLAKSNFFWSWPNMLRLITFLRN